MIVEDAICVRIVNSVQMSSCPRSLHDLPLSVEVERFRAHLWRCCDRLLPDVFYESEEDVQSLLLSLLRVGDCYKVEDGWSYLRLGNSCFRIRGDVPLSVFARLQDLSPRSELRPRCECRGDLLVFFPKKTDDLRLYTSQCTLGIRSYELTESDKREMGYDHCVGFRLTGFGQFRLSRQGVLVLTAGDNDSYATSRPWQDRFSLSSLCKHVYSRFVFVQKDDQDYAYDSPDFVSQGPLLVAVTRDFFIGTLLEQGLSLLPGDLWEKELSFFWDVIQFRQLESAEIYVFLSGVLRRLSAENVRDVRYPCLENHVLTYGRYQTLIRHLLGGRLDLDSAPDSIIRPTSLPKNASLSSFVDWVLELLPNLPVSLGWLRLLVLERRFSLDFYSRVDGSCLHLGSCSCSFVASDDYGEFCFPLGLSGRLFLPSLIACIERWDFFFGTSLKRVLRSRTVRLPETIACDGPPVLHNRVVDLCPEVMPDYGSDLPLVTCSSHRYYGDDLIRPDSSLVRVLRPCSVCHSDLPEDAFSPIQLSYSRHVCLTCSFQLFSMSAFDPHSGGGVMVVCKGCHISKPRPHYSNNQWVNKRGVSRCISCVAYDQQNVQYRSKKRDVRSGADDGLLGSRSYDDRGRFLPSSSSLPPGVWVPPSSSMTVPDPPLEVVDSVEKLLVALCSPLVGTSTPIPARQLTYQSVDLCGFCGRQYCDCF